MPPSTSRRMVMITGHGPLGGQPLEIDLPVDVIQPQLDELGPLAYQVTMLRNDVPVAAAADGDANHETIRRTRDR